MAKKLLMSPDMDLADELRMDLTTKTCVDALFMAAVEMAASIGVTVSYEIHDIDTETPVDQERLTKSLGRMATASGALLAGGRINPIAQLHAQDPIRIIKEQQNKDAR